MPAANFRRRVLYRVQADPEYAAETWWQAARASDTVPAALRPLLALDGPDALTLSRRDALAVEAWAAALPGYAAGPAYARCALRIQRLARS